MNLMGWFLFLWIALGAACATPSGTHTVTEEGQTVANNIPNHIAADFMVNPQVFAALGQNINVMN